jgi:hypothetical protein
MIDDDGFFIPYPLTSKIVLLGTDAKLETKLNLIMYS